jgi:UDP:flavonoid glycosyltransferase YjiC (YdhE family)
MFDTQKRNDEKSSVNVTSSKPLIGFFPLFDNLAETGRAVKVANLYLQKGGEAVFFSHGGKYEHLAEDIRCKVIQVHPTDSEKFIEDVVRYAGLEKLRNPITDEILEEYVNGEVKAFKENGIKLIVSTNNFWTIISARLANIPLVNIAPKVKSKFLQYPDDVEFFFTKIFPKSIKLKIINWYLPRTKWMAKPFNKAAKKYNIKISKKMSDYDLVKGDFTLYTDVIEFLGIESHDIAPNEYFIGPISLEGIFKDNASKQEDIESEKEIEKHLQKNGKKILVSLGSSGKKEIFLEILEALNNTDYKVIAIYTTILDEKEIPNVSDNIMLKKIVPSINKFHKMVDLSIIHGGQGTVYAAAYAGKPVIGIPMTLEQHLNLENLVRENMAILLSKKYFKKGVLINSINKIFNNYNYYLSNAEKFSKNLPFVDGEKNAVLKLLTILKQEKHQ